MLEKLSERISQIDKISKYIFKYGLLFCLGLFMFINYNLNNASTMYDVLQARQVAGAGFNVLVEVVVGAVLFDICMKNK